MSTDLHLNLSRDEFDAIKRGEQKAIIKPITDMWYKLLVGQSYERVLVKADNQVLYRA